MRLPLEVFRAVADAAGSDHSCSREVSGTDWVECAWDIKQTAHAGMDLPKPSAQRGRKKKSKAIQEEFMLQDFSRSIIDSIKRTGQH